MNKFISRMAVWCLATGLLAGCGKGNGGTARSFDNAPPEIKAEWSKAFAADQANDYIAAASGYQMIVNQSDKLSVDQCQLVSDARSKLFSRLNSAAQRGDANARKALDALRRSPPH